MSALTKCLLLFLLNWLDAQLTIFWVRAGLASEGNSLMASLLDAGNWQFLSVKLLIGASVAFILYRYAQLPLARRGVKFALGIYCLLMLVHAATGLNAVGLFPANETLAQMTQVPHNLLSVLIF